MMKVPASKYLILLLALLLSLPLTIYSGQPVHADGSAPNLAYVSGTTAGISVIDVLNPVDSGTTAPPTEPDRVIHLATPPTSIAITNDGLLGFVAMQGGKVAMLDLLGRHIVYTLTVGGNPHFIITGLYPPTTNLPSPTVSKSSPPLRRSSLSPSLYWHLYCSSHCSSCYCACAVLAAELLEPR